MVMVEPSAAMAVSDDPGGTAPITHVYDAWLSVALLARAGAAPTVKVLATTMAAKSIFFIASPPPLEFCHGGRWKLPSTGTHPAGVSILLCCRLVKSESAPGRYEAAASGPRRAAWKCN